MNKIELFNDIMDLEEFILVRYKNGFWGVKDLQGANLGNIENDTFDNLSQVLDRMEIYHIDYLEEPIMEYYDIDEHNGYADLVKQCREKIRTNKKYQHENEYHFDLCALELIGNAPKYDIFTCKIDNVITQGLNFEQYEEDYINVEEI